MKKELPILFILFTLFFFSTNAQTYKWVHGGGSATYSASTYNYSERSRLMATDPNGNVYSVNVVGGGTVYADTFIRRNYSRATNYNALVTSYDCTGQMRWAKLIGTTNGIDIYGIAVDSFGHVYLTGSYYNAGDTLHIGTDTAMSTGYVCAGTIQLDTNGRFRWIRFVGQNTYAGAVACIGDAGTAVLDGQQNIHCVKLFKSGAQLTSSITSVYGTYDISYNAAGSLLSVKRLTLDSSLVVQHASIDTNNNKLFVTGHYNPAFGTYPPTAFVAAFDTFRNAIWSDTLGHRSGDDVVFTGIKTDHIGHLYLVAAGGDTISYRGGGVSGGSAGYYISAFMKTDTSGNLLWTRAYNGTLNCAIVDMTLMPNGKIAGVGNILGRVVSDGDTIISYASEANNYFFTVLDTGGCVHTLEQPHANAFYDYGICIASDRIGNLFVGGAVGDSTWGGSVGYRTHGGNTDFFVMKYGVDCSCTSMPIANYALTRSGLGGSTVVFNNTGTSTGLDSLRWYFGDGSTSTAATPTHTYTAPGTYHATLRIYSPCGWDMHCMEIFVPCVAVPTSGFNTTGYTATRGFAYTGTTVALDSIVWSFGDGGRDTGFSATHIYGSIGTYTACATAYNPCGSNSVCSTLTLPCLAAPTSAFTHSGVTASRSFTYTGTTTALDSVVWQYGDGGRSTGTTGAHTYGAIGTYTVCAFAYNPCGGNASCDTITVRCLTAPSAAFTHSGVTTINFTYTGTATGLDSVVWHYGDGGRGTGTASSHTYGAVGTYTVCVLAYNPCGVDSTCHTVTIVCTAPPVASFTNTTPILGSYTDTFTYTGTTTGLDSIGWYFGDGGHGTGTTAYHTYAVPDTYTVCVYAYNPCGWDSTCYTVIIPCDTPTAAFTHTHGNPVSFTYTGTTNHVDSVVWRYGDLTGGTGVTTSHGYGATGTYTVCVVAYGICAIDSFCDTVWVSGLGAIGGPDSYRESAVGSLSVYPNPVVDELTVGGVWETMEYRLFSVAGVTLQRGTLGKGTNKLPVKDYAPGVYVLEIVSHDGEREMIRVVKE